MFYFLFILLNFNSPQTIQDLSFIGNWQVIEMSDIDDPDDKEIVENMTMNIYSDGKLEVNDEGDIETRNWKIINNIFYLIDGEEKEMVEIKVSGDNMTWIYDGEVIVFKRIK